MLALVFVASSGCATIPPSADAEGCDHFRESAKLAGSDLVADGDLYCAGEEGDCELKPARIVAHKGLRPAGGARIPVHILRREAEAHTKELFAQNAISLCYPANLWFPGEGHSYGRFYMVQENDGRFRMAFYPRVRL